MMSSFHKHAWVTSACSDSEMSYALVLCYSLRRTCTTKQTVLIASDQLTEHFMAAAQSAFDFVFTVRKFTTTGAIRLDDFVKLYGIGALTGFKACVYLSPTMFVLKNSDKVFGQLESSEMAMIVGQPNVSMFVFKPLTTRFRELLTYAKRNSEASFYDLLLEFGATALPPNYDGRVINGKDLLAFPDSVCIVDLADCLPTSKSLESLKQIGILGKLVAEYWHRIQTEDVSPLLEGNLAPWNEESQLLTRYSKKDPIAIVGMSCRYPAANNLEEFWEVFSKGIDVMGNFPENRQKLYANRRIMSKFHKFLDGGFLKVPVDEFDANFFGISPQEAVFIDPQNRLLLELVWEALEHACINPHSLHETLGSVFVGSWQASYKNVLSDSGVDNFYRTYMGNSIGSMASRISFFLGMTGPNVANESGCSSSMVAVHMALEYLRKGNTNLALACGVNLMLEPIDPATMPLLFAPDGRCKPFSADANGYARSEGVGVLVLKRMSDAIKDGDKIWGLIRGSAIAQEGMSMSMGTPTVFSETQAMKHALADAKVTPDQVSFVEAHGTGTPVGDPLEVAAITQVYGSSTRKDSLVIGSFKGNVGHNESCSGITGIMKVVLAMHHETIPRQLNLTKLNPAINLESIPAVIPLEQMPWKRAPGKPRLAGVSSFGITGTDAHVILEEPPQIQFSNALTVKQKMVRPVHLLKLSAKTQEAMDIMLENYKSALETMECPLGDIAYSANVGRADFPIRATILGKNAQEMVEMIKMKKYSYGDTTSGSMGKVCFLFTGQGSQYSGMAKSLYDHSPIFQSHFDFCAKILEGTYNVDIKTILWSDKEDSNSDISRTIYSQTSIFCVEYALLKLWESWDVKPDYVLGHSLGEFAATVCAGILSVEDAMKLVAERSRLVDNLPQGKMLVIRANQNRVESLMNRFCGDDASNRLDYAAVNSSMQTVVAGDTDKILEFAEFCGENDLKCIILNATHAFHSKHMDPILSIYKDVASTVKKGSSQNCKYISGVKGVLIGVEAIDAQYWVDHTREKVDFLTASKMAVELGCQTFIEIGPLPVLSALTMMNSEGKITCFPSLKRNAEDWSTILNSLGSLYVKGMEINWKGLDQLYSRQKVQLPTYPFLRKRYWPEMTQTHENNFHPLIGSIIPNASSIKLFQSTFYLSSHEYMKDHAIGGTAVFPAAGYLEMSLAAGLTTLNMIKSGLPVKVENLRIQAPLALHKENTAVFQTVAQYPDLAGSEGSQNTLDIKIHHRLENDSAEKWLQHASAIFSPLLQPDDRKFDFDPKEFLDLISKPCNTTNYYQRSATVGLNFGPEFQSLETIWRSTDNSKFVAQVKNLEKSGPESKYVWHPITLDAMIQAIFFFSLADKLKKKLYVPVKIGKFVWLLPGKLDCKDKYVYVYNATSGVNEDTQSFTALLLDSLGTVIAVLSGVELVPTLVKTLESIIAQQTCPLPDLWDITMKGENGSAYGFHNTENCSIKVAPNAETDIELPPDLQELDDRINELVYLQILRCFYQCGFHPVKNATFATEQFRDKLEIQKGFSQLFRHMLHILEKQGILKNIDGDKLEVTQVPPSIDHVEKTLRSPIFTEQLLQSFRSTSLIRKLGEYMKAILTGKMQALPILFPESNTSNDWSSVDDFYEEYAKVYPAYKVADKVVRRNLEMCIKEHEARGEKYILRICEVGAGTGIGTQMMLNALEELGIEHEYTFTDITSAYFAKTEKKFEKYLDKLTFKTLDLEKDPLTQGFIPAYYDIVLALEVVHATRNLRETFNHINMILKPGGRLELCEQSQMSRLALSISGYLEGFWRFDDTELRPHSCILSLEKWVDIMERCGLSAVGVYSSFKERHGFFSAQKIHDISDVLQSQKLLYPQLRESNSKIWIIFHEEDSPASNFVLQNIRKFTNRKLVVVTRGQKYDVGSDTNTSLNADDERDYEKLMSSLEVTSVEGIVYCWALNVTCTSQEDILKPLLYLSKAVLRTTYSPGLKLVALTNGAAHPDNNPVTHCDSSTVTGFIKSLSGQKASIKCKAVDIAGIGNDTQLMQIFHELWGSREEIELAFCNTTRYVPQIKRLKPALSELKFPPGVDRFRLVLPESKQIEDLQYGTLEPFELNDGQIEIQVKASALNFRDVLSVLKPSEEFNNSNTIGFDYSGTVKRLGPHVTKWKAGDRVFGVNLKGHALPSHIAVNEEDVFGMPSNITYAEASTLPVVMATSIHCLLNIAKIRATDTVLIHTASGGVGLLAIQLCKYVGATVIATAGSKRKQNYLRNLGIQHVFNSRNTDYEKKILEVTNGRGVDAVLNSLTSKGFKEATLNCCAKNARFVEIGRLNIWTPMEVRKLRPDVRYTIYLLSTTDSRQLLSDGKKLLDKGVIQPISYVRFDVTHIREALQYLQNTKHVGKVVCIMPEFRQQADKMELHVSMFHENATYLITGGMGGIGFLICKWMLEKGARYVILAGRNTPNIKRQEEINRLNTEHQACVKAVQMDVSKFEACQNLLQNQIPALSYPELRGIFYTAGCIQDGLVENQTWSNFEQTFAPKVNGTMNLHELTKDNPQIEYFVLFSSIASTLGTAGQSNYAAANQFKDALAHYRYSLGLPATSINWGQWGEVGLATEYDFPGMKPITNQQGIAALEYALKTQQTQLGVCNIESLSILQSYYPNVGLTFEKGTENMQTSKSSVEHDDQFWQKFEHLSSPEDRFGVLEATVKDIIRGILKLKQTDEIKSDRDLQEIGVDSLMFVEIKNALQYLLANKVTLSNATLQDCRSVFDYVEALTVLVEKRRLRMIL